MSTVPGRLARALTVLVAAATLLLAPARPVHACSCALPLTPDLAFNVAQAVFTGTVTHSEAPLRFDFWDRLLGWLGRPPVAGFDTRRVTLAVAASWKGVTHSPVTIGTGLGGADCGFEFIVGQQYLVYGYDNHGDLVTSICTRTTEIALAQADLTYLQPLPALAVTPAPSPLLSFCLPALGVFLVLLSLLGGLGRALWSRLRRPGGRLFAPPPS